MAEDDAPPARSGGGVGKKFGPLPVWAWAVLLGGGVGLVWFLRNRSASAAAASSATQQPTGADTPTSLVPINEGLSEQQYRHLKDQIEDMNGPPSTDDDDDQDDDDDKPKPKPPTPKPPTPKPKPKPKPPHQMHPGTVTVAKWNNRSAPWNSTLWGIANKEHVRGGYRTLQRINHIRNPRTIQPGQKIKL